MTDVAVQETAHDASACPRCTERRACIESIAAACGVPVHTIEWISAALNFSGTYRRKGGATDDVDAAELCRMLLADFNEGDPARLRAALAASGIRSSRDIGRIVYAMVDAGLCAAGESDAQQDFDAIFEADDLAGYLDRSGLRRARDWPVAIKSALVMGCTLGGAALAIAGSQRVAWSQGLWIGSALLGAGWLLSIGYRPRPRRFGLAWSTLERRPAS